MGRVKDGGKLAAGTLALLGHLAGKQVRKPGLLSLRHAAVGRRGLHSV